MRRASLIPAGAIAACERSAFLAFSRECLYIPGMFRIAQASALPDPFPAAALRTAATLPAGLLLRPRGA